MRYSLVVTLFVVWQVQADQYVPTEDLQVEMGQVDKHLEALEQKGVELERNLRDCKNGSSNSFYPF